MTPPVRLFSGWFRHGEDDWVFGRYNDSVQYYKKTKYLNYANDDGGVTEHRYVDGAPGLPSSTLAPAYTRVAGFLTNIAACSQLGGSVKADDDCTGGDLPVYIAESTASDDTGDTDDTGSSADTASASATDAETSSTDTGDTGGVALTSTFWVGGGYEYLVDDYICTADLKMWQRSTVTWAEVISSASSEAWSSTGTLTDFGVGNVETDSVH